MRSNVRTAWIAVGGTLTALTVSGIALAVWPEVSRTQADDPSYDSSLLAPARLSETSVRDYTFLPPDLVVLASGQADVTVVPGRTGQLSLKRELVWTEGGPGPSSGRPDLSESWNGRTLRIHVDCHGRDEPGDPACQGRYTLSVPVTTDVTATTDSGTVSGRTAQGELRILPYRRRQG
ncbi:hypothetical protein GCM10023075_11240 [Streptosporangium album]